MITTEALAPVRCWVAWQTEDRTDGKATKVPYAPNGAKARADASATWGTRSAAEAMAARLNKPYGVGGVGIEFTEIEEGRSLGGVDLDSCRNPETGDMEDWARRVIELLDSYAEISPSRSGVKIFFTYPTEALPTLRGAMGGSKWGKMFKRSGGEHPPAIELHLGNRYFAVTDAKLPDSPEEFRHIEPDVILRLLQVHGPAFCGAGRTDKPPEAGKPERRRQTTDRSRSAAAFAIGKKLRRDGFTFEQMVEALRVDPATAAWAREKGEPNGQREFHRIWERAESKGSLIRLVPGELHHAATSGEAALIDARLPIFQRGNSLVRPISSTVAASRGRTTIAACLAELGVHNLVDQLCAVAEWEKFDARSEGWVRCNPPIQVAQIMLARHGEWRLPPIAGVIATPTLRPDGSILSAPGYDSMTRLYHVVDPNLVLRPALQRPSRPGAQQALALLEGLLGEFPFVVTEKKDLTASHVSKAVALSALITPVVRGALGVAPAHVLRANTAGSGKSYLADVASAISTGRPCPVISASPDEAEMEKRIAGLLLAGYPLISLDNVNGELGGDLLCQAIERPLIRIRRLGGSDIVEIENSATILCTGNQLRVRGDMVRRTLVADLDAGVERPELRKFQADPVAVVLADRGSYVSACLTIVRAYIADGCPGDLPAIASFAGWSRLVRSALVWLGCDDPAESMETAREDDPELAELRELLTLWAQHLGIGEGFTVRDLIERVDRKKPTQMGEPTDVEMPDLRDALIRIAGERGFVNGKRLGKWLMNREGRIVNKLKVTRSTTGANNGLVRWRVVRAS